MLKYDIRLFFENDLRFSAAVEGVGADFGNPKMSRTKSSSGPTPPRQGVGVSAAVGSGPVEVTAGGGLRRANCCARTTGG